MSRLDDELRSALRERAGRVQPPADPMAGVESRARRIRRRRAAVRLSGAALGVAMVVGLPLATMHLGTDQRAAAGQNAPTRAATGTKPATASTTASPKPVPKGAPENVLHWGVRGASPPEPFVSATRKRLAVETARRGGDPGSTHERVLWTGPLPDGRWARLAQVWNPTDPRHDRAWSTMLLVGEPNGVEVDDPYDLETQFLHQRPGEPAKRTTDDVGRIAGYAFGFRGFVLVVGAPRASEAALTVDGHHVLRRRLTHGGAVIPLPSKRPSMELVQLRDSRGRLLTPNDMRGAKYAEGGATVKGWSPDIPLSKSPYTLSR